MPKYQEHLNSGRWKTIRKEAGEISQYRCVLCYSPREHTHHIRYPKDLKEDTSDNVIPVCAVCHNKLHGKNLNHPPRSLIDLWGSMAFAQCKVSQELKQINNEIKAFKKDMQTLLDLAREYEESELLTMPLGRDLRTKLNELEKFKKSLEAIYEHMEIEQG